MTSDQGSHARVITPDLEREVEGYLARAASARDADERLDFLSRALALDPEHPLAVSQMTEAVRGRLAEDPSLAYVAEDDHLYLVRAASGHDLAVPKNRFASTTDLTESPILRRSRRWLACALVGLLPAGLGTLVCAPVAGVLATLAILQTRVTLERRRAVEVIVGAALLFVGSLALVILLLMHV